MCIRDRGRLIPAERQRDAGPITFFALSGCICSGEEGMAVAARHPPCAKGGQTAEGGQGGLTALSYIIDTSCRVWGFWLGALNPPGGAGRHPPLHKGGFFAALHTTSFSETLGGEPPLPYLSLIHI